MAEQFGSYTILRRLGAGGMAEVFLARTLSSVGIERLLAIKRLLTPFNSDKQIISMLSDEARLSVWLNHPNIVQVLDFGRVENTYFIAMEYVNGCDLCDLVRPAGHTPGKPLPLATALYVMLQVADALDYAHRRRNRRGELLGIIHRDMSPHNVLISREGQVKLADFGLARASISIHTSHTGVIRGKFSYMPKEQAKGGKIDHRIDLFGAGCTLYEMLTGMKPYSSTNLAQQLYQLDRPIPPPSAYLPEIPQEIDDITLQAMSPEPETRYSSAEEFARDLRDAFSKISTFNQEAIQLATLVQKAVGSPPHSEEPLLPMSLQDFPIGENSLIGDALEEVQHSKTAPQRLDGLKSDTLQEVIIPPPEAFGSGVRAPIDDHVSMAEANLISVDESLDNLPTMAMSSSQAAMLAKKTERDAPLIKVSSGLRARVDPSSPTDLMPPLGDPLSPSLPKVTVDVPLDRDFDRRTDEYASSLDSQPSHPQTEKSLSQPAHDHLEEARTVQRSPEEALTAFKRALAERESPGGQVRNHQEQRPIKFQSRLSLRATLLLGAGGLVLFGIGLGTGWFLHNLHPGSPILIKSTCPEPRPCPVCPKTLQPEHAAMAPSTQPRSAPDSQPQSAPATQATTETEPTDVAPPGKVLKKKPVRKSALSSIGFLSVQTNAAAKIYIDDRTSALRAPLFKFPLASGKHSIRVYSVEKKIFSDAQRVNIRPGKNTMLSFELE